MSDLNGNTIKYRVEQVEKCVDSLDDKVDRIMTNHLPHIQKEIFDLKDSLRKDMGVLKDKITENTVKIGALVAVGAALVNAVIGFFIDKL